MAVATDTIWRGETSMKSTSAALTYSTSPPLRRTRTRSSRNLPDFWSVGELACATTWRSSSSAVR